jgi:hypothetical protein
VARHTDGMHGPDGRHSLRMSVRRGSDRVLSPFGHAVQVITLTATVVCAGSKPPAASPSPVVSAEPLPAMFDMGEIPDRPHLDWSNRTRAVIRRDTVTGQYVGVTVHDSAPGDSVSPDTNDSRLYYRAGLYAHGINPSLASAAFYWASRLDPGWADPYFARWYTLRSAPYTYTFRFSSHRDAAARTIMDPRAPFVIPDSVWMRIVGAGWVLSGGERAGPGDHCRGGGVRPDLGGGSSAVTARGV